MGNAVTLRTSATTTLTAGAAHDLRNLLFVVSAHSHRLLAEAGPDHPWTEDLQAVQQAADRCTELAAQILSEAKLLEQPSRPIDVNAVITGVEPLITQLLGDRVMLLTSLSADAWPVTANTVQIEQIVMNLAVNARDAMPEGGTLNIATENRSITGGAQGQPSHFVVISVSDTGTGIEPHVQERMFEPYFTTKSETGGTGVGLATVRNIAILHGGHVEVATAPGRGTTFRVVLPRTSAQAAPPRLLVEEPNRTSQSLRVLTISQNPGVREEIVRTLTAEGHAASAAENGAEAIGWSSASASPIDVLITDLFLPDVNGLEVASCLRRQWPSIGIVFLTDVDDALDDIPPSVPLLSKPFTAHALDQAIRRAIAPNRTG